MSKLEFLKKTWIGQRVISISNAYQTDPTDESLQIGEVVGVNSFNGESYLPNVKYESDGQTYLSFATIVYYDDDLLKILKKLTAEERYMLSMAICHRFQ